MLRKIGTVYSFPIFLLLALAIILGGPFAAAQSPEPAFDVASIRKIGPDANGRIPCRAQSAPQRVSSRISGGTFRLPLITISGLIMDAYSVREDQFSGLPAWADCQDIYEVTAKTGVPGVTEDQLRLMLQTLLANRFQLQLRHETRNLTVYEMSIAKGGLKVPVFPDRAEGHRTAWGIISTLIELFLDYPLVDKTGISGFISDDAPKWDQQRLQEEMREARPAGLPPGIAFHGLAPSIFHEAEAAFGLTLKKVSAPSDFLVIEHVERPSAN